MWLYPDPRATAAALERRRPVPAGSAERFAGYGVIALPFASGHLLAFRRCVASSIGPPYTSIWHRSPAGRWTFYADVQPDRACPRFFADACSRVVVGEVRIEWRRPAEVSLSAPAERLHWTIRLTSSPAIRLANAAVRLVPAARRPRLLPRLALPAATALAGGRVTLTGTTPSGHRFGFTPHQLWQVDGCAATIEGRELGPTAPLPAQDRLGDFWLPNAGLFAFGEARFDTK